MRESLSKTSGNLQGELAARDSEIAKLGRRIQDLDKEILALKKQLADE
jgi:hypothetical protein